MLVIWPKFTDCVVTHDLESACIELRDEVDNSDTASPEQRATIDYLLNRQAATYDDAVLIADAICHAACRWRDLDLWKRTVEKCSGAAGVVTLDVEDACIAIKTFGFDAVRPR